MLCFSCGRCVSAPSSLRTGPSTPLTPCRLSLGDRLPLRRATTSSLAKLVVEKGISALSADNSRAAAAAAAAPPLLLHPDTPPNSPSHASVESRQQPADNFLASRPAELFLQDVYGVNLGRAPHPDLPSPNQAAPLKSLGMDPGCVGLLQRLQRLGFNTAPQRTEAPQDAATLVSASGGSLLDGLRRNHSLPAMIGARGGRSAPSPAPPPHPTSLALPPPPWGNLSKRCQKPAAHTPSTSGRR